MKTFKILTLIALLLLSMAGMAENEKGTDANLVGDVTDAKTGEHVPYINITINNTVIGTTTDRSGHYF